MISKLSEKAVATLFANEELNEGDRELYIYGFFMLFSHLFFLTLTIFYGFLFGIIFESIVFHVIFTVLRGYAGGVHASTEKMCILSTSLSLLFCVVLIKVLGNLSSILVPTLMLAISAIIIVVYSPLDSLEKPLTEAEKKLYKKKTTNSTLLFLLVSYVAMISGLLSIYFSCAAAMLLECILLSVGVLTKYCHTG